MSSAPKPRPKYYDLSLAHLPPPGLVSILHRISGLLLFFPILPALLYLMDAILGSQQGYAHWRDFFSRPLVKVALVGVVWLYAHHFWAGIRYLLLDMHWGIAKSPARTTAYVVFALGAITTLLIAWRIW
ncbi:MAG TPA: succinate dehydrogenase, cytochrome b556 subunit [Usitatibacter sp.]|nr:succinate dehydrogenase, cytochrome b556 subunit [Usitatibacter sp.]